MFRAVRRSSSGALTIFAASDLHTHVVTGCSQVWVGVFPLRLDYGRSPHAYVNQRLQIQLELLMMSGVPLQTCWAFNERWNNKFYYKVASCWLFLLNHTTMHGSMNIKLIDMCWIPIDFGKMVFMFKSFYFLLRCIFIYYNYSSTFICCFCYYFLLAIHKFVLLRVIVFRTKWLQCFEFLSCHIFFCTKAIRIVVSRCLVAFSVSKL